MKAVQVDAAEQFKQKLDRLGSLLYRELSSDAEPWRAELKALKTEIQAHYAGHPADVPIRAAGDRYFIDLTVRENRRSITDPQKAFDALKKAMTMAKLVEALKIPFSLLDRWVTADRQAAWVKQERSGSRDISAVLIAPPVEEAA